MHEVVWVPWQKSGIESTRVGNLGLGPVANGLVVGEENGVVYRLQYVIRCDLDWRTREVRITPLAGTSPPLHLLSDGAGYWTTVAGVALPDLDGCLDIDLSVSAFTNTLPIKRLGLGAGLDATIAVVYIAVPTFVVSQKPQRYTRLIETPVHLDTLVASVETAADLVFATRSLVGRYRFEALDSGYTAELPVDRQGFVEDYPGLFRRVPFLVRGNREAALATSRYP